MTTEPTTTKKTTETPRSNKIALSKTLDYVAATEGIDQLRMLDEHYGLIPAAARDHIEPALNRIEKVLRESRVTALELAMHPSTILSMLTSIPTSQLTRYHPSNVAERLHTDRNLSLAVAALAASTILVDSVGTSPAAVHSNSVKLARRSSHIRRPLADDEIVLCRVAAHLAALKDPRDHTAAIYSYLDAGLVPGETTHVTIADHDEAEGPQHVLACGNAQLAVRILELDPFTSHILGRHIEYALRANHSRIQPLTYRPRSRKYGERHLPGSSSATASAQGVIDRFLKQLRMPTGDITASSITQWRIAHTLSTHGAIAAFELSGRAHIESMFRALGTVNAKPTPRPDNDVSFAACA